MTATTLHEAIAGILGLALVVVAGVWLLALTLALGETLAGPRGRWLRRVPCPKRARGWALAVAGLLFASTLAAPASAGQSADQPTLAQAAQPSRGEGIPRLAGLRLPDRLATRPLQDIAPAATIVARASTATVVVLPGDTLWAIAARSLPLDASDAEIAARWQRIARFNSAVLADPDVIFPGMHLRIPPLSHRKDSS